MAGQDSMRRRTGTGGGAGSGPRAQTEIPDKLYFRIGEVARLCEVPAYVLRFWESEFTQLKPNKGGTGQRLYRRRDVEMAMRIKTLLYDEGYTIPGARQAFKAELRTSRESGGRDAQLGLDGVSDAVETKHLLALQKDLRELHALLSRPAAGLVRSSLQPIRPPRAAAPPKPLPAPMQFPGPGRQMPRKPSGGQVGSGLHNSGHAGSLFDDLPEAGEFSDSLIPDA